MTMPKAATIAKVLATLTIIPSVPMVLMGLGLVPVDEKLVGIASPFLEPFGIPFRPFMCVLGPAKILGALSLWGIGPMPEFFGRIGLATAALCGAYGLNFVGDSTAPALVYSGIIASLYVLDPMKKGKKE